MKLLNKVRIGLFYNLRQDFPKLESSPRDVDAEWDGYETINDIQQGLESNGFQIVDLGDPKRLLEESVRDSIDIVFSICEMQGYRFRESLVPALCEFLSVPYVFSSPDTMMISLDKNLCNMVVQQAGCNVPDWFLIGSAQDIDRHRFDAYPYIVKPAAEGSGMGIDEKSVVHHDEHLVKQCKLIINTYNQPAIVQTFVAGREFTIGVIEQNHTVIPFVPLEIKPITVSPYFTYNFYIKENREREVQFCPLTHEPNLMRQIADLAIASFKAIGCRDAARVDIRLSHDGVPYFLEINPLPNFHCGRGNFCMSAKAAGLEYGDVLGDIVRNASLRYNLLHAL